MKTVELFSGCGGLSYGLMQAGMECIGFVEMDKYAHKAFKILHDPEERMWARHDITSVTDDDIRLFGEQRGGIDLISAGFPCQSFSIAGKRAGFADATRGTLFFQIIRFAEILKPKYLLLENVKGLLNHDGGRTYATILCALDELGYDCEWQLLNSKDYGVPQNRERVFIVCHSRTASGRKIFPISGENSEVDCILEGKLALPGKDQWNRVYSEKVLSPTLTTMQGGRQEPKVLLVGNTNPSGNGMNGSVYDSAGLAPTITTNKGEGPKVLQRLFAGKYSVKEDETGTLQASRVDKVPMIVEPIPCLTPDRVEKRQNGRRFKEPGEPMFTLTAQDKHGVAIQNEIKVVGMLDMPGHDQKRRVYDSAGISPTLNGIGNGGGLEPKVMHEYRIRKLTPLECFRLQSWPDEWYYKLKGDSFLDAPYRQMVGKGFSDSQLYKMAGNGVTSNVTFEIGKRLMEVHNAL